MVQQPSTVPTFESVEERKRQIQQRIQRLQQQNQQRTESSAKRFAFLDKV